MKILITSFMLAMSLSAFAELEVCNGDKISDFESCVNTNFSLIQREIDHIDLELNQCSLLGDFDLPSFATCVNDNFKMVKEALPSLNFQRCHSTTTMNTAIVNCINNNFEKVDQEL